MDSLDFFDKAPLGRRRSRSVGNLTQLNALAPPQVFAPAPVYVQAPQPVGISGIYAGPMLKMINSLLTEAEKQRIRAFDQMQQSIESLQRPPQRMYIRQQPPPPMPMGLQVQPQYGGPLPPQPPIANPGSHGGLPSYVPLSQNFQPSPMSQPLNPPSMKFGPAVTHGAPYSPVSPTMRSPRSQAPGSPYVGLGVGGRPQNVGGLDVTQGLDFSHPIKSIARKRSSSLSCLPRLRGDMPVPMLNVDLNLQIPPIEVSGPSQQWQTAGVPPPAPTVADYQDKESKLREFESFLEFPDPHISEAERKMGRTTDRNRARSMPTVNTRQPLYPVQSLPSSGTPLTPILGYPESGGLLDPSDMGGLDVNMSDMTQIPAIQVQNPLSPNPAGSDSGSWLGGAAITTNDPGEFDLDVPMQNAFRQMSITENPAGNLQTNPNAMNVFGGPMGGSYGQGSANRSVSGIVREILGESEGPNDGSGGLNGNGSWQVEDDGKNELMRLDTETINRLIN